MALAWKAGWVQALAGSNPASSAELTRGNAVGRCSAPRAAEKLSLSFSPHGPRFGLIWAGFGDVSERRRTPTDAHNGRIRRGACCESGRGVAGYSANFVQADVGDHAATDAFSVPPSNALILNIGRGVPSHPAASPRVLAPAHSGVGLVDAPDLGSRPMQGEGPLSSMKLRLFPRHQIIEVDPAQPLLIVTSAANSVID